MKTITVKKATFVNGKLCKLHVEIPLGMNGNQILKWKKQLDVELNLNK